MYVSGTGSNACDIIEAVNTLLTVTLGTTNKWTVKYTKNANYNGISRLAEAIWCGIGDGNDKIYIQMRIPNTPNIDGINYDINNANKIDLDGLAGYDENLEYFEQPGSIQNSLGANGSASVAQPSFLMATESLFSYWIFADTKRVVITLKLSTYYESMYLGFINPVSSERQFPYPMYVAGNGISSGQDWPQNTNGSFVFPSAGSGYLRRADGTWRMFDAYGDGDTFPTGFTQGTIFPYNSGNTSLVTNYTSSTIITTDNELIFPIMLCTTIPYDICGLLDGVFYISGAKDIASESILTYNGDQYMIVDTKNYRGSNTYFCIKMA